MYYTGIDPRTGESVYIPKDPHEKAMQRALIQYRDPKLYDLVKEALIKCGRQDLIGFGPECLIAPRNIGQKNNKNSKPTNRQGAKSDAKQGSIRVSSGRQNTNSGNSGKAQHAKQRNDSNISNTRQHNKDSNGRTQSQRAKKAFQGSGNDRSRSGYSAGKRRK